MTRLRDYLQLTRTQKLDKQLDEIDRELGVRRRMYPQWVAKGTMKQEQSEYQMKLLEEIKETVRQARVDSMMRGMNGQRLDQPSALKGPQGPVGPAPVDR